MKKFKYQIKEGIVKPQDAPKGLLQRMEKKYGIVDMENDFFSDNFDTYFKTTYIDDDESEQKIIKLGGFGNSLESLSQALSMLTALSRKPENRENRNIQELTQKLRDVFNQYRTYIRKNYPDQYKDITNKLQEMSSTGGTSNFTPGKGMNYTSPKTFKPQFGYKLVPKKIKRSGLKVKQIFKEKKDSMEIFQQKRISAFDEIETELNSIYQLLSNAKNETIKYYQSNPGSYDIFMPTDLVKEYLTDIKKLLT